MTDYRTVERQLSENLQLKNRPVAITFRDAAPAGVSKFTGAAPSGCSFWKLAAAGQTFYTVPDRQRHIVGFSPRPATEAEQITATFLAANYANDAELRWRYSRNSRPRT